MIGQDQTMPISQFDDYSNKDCEEDELLDPGFWDIIAQIEAEHDYLESCGGW